MVDTSDGTHTPPDGVAVHIKFAWATPIPGDEDPCPPETYMKLVEAQYGSPDSAVWKSVGWSMGSHVKASTDVLKVKDVVGPLYHHLPGLATKVYCPHWPNVYANAPLGTAAPGASCPPGHKLTILETVMHLNDYWRWTREQIADWLESLDVDLTFSIDTADMTACQLSCCKSEDEEIDAFFKGQKYSGSLVDEVTYFKPSANLEDTLMKKLYELNASAAALQLSAATATNKLEQAVVAFEKKGKAKHLAKTEKGKATWLHRRAKQSLEDASSPSSRSSRRRWLRSRRKS